MVATLQDCVAQEDFSGLLTTSGQILGLVVGILVSAESRFRLDRLTVAVIPYFPYQMRRDGHRSTYRWAATVSIL